MAPYDNSLWFVETNTHPLLDSGGGKREMVNYIRPSFLSRFWELQQVMWETNAALTERHAYDSRPSTWPVLRRGINFWTKDHRQIYLIGNPLIWYASLCAIMVYAGARTLLMLRAKRGCRDFQDSTIVFYDQTAGFLALGWGMHFLPFFAMHRQLFLHHYLPALYFSILLLAVLFDVVTSGLRPKFRFVAAIALVAIAFASYSTYAPITYATPWTQGACERSRLLKSWDFNCRDFPKHPSAYTNYGPGIHTASGLVPHKTGGVTGVDGDVTASQVNQAASAQAGNHAFEQQPKKAAQSGKIPPAGGGVDVGVGVDEDGEPFYGAAGGQGGDAGVPGQVVSAAPDDDGGSEEPIDLEGLDQEGMEAVVMGGTAEKAPARTRISDGAPLQSSAAQPDINAGSQGDEGDEVHVVPDV